jgi:AraC-like DNA-binding protein
MKNITSFITLLILLLPFSLSAQSFSDEELEHISFDSLRKIEDAVEWESEEYRALSAIHLQKAKSLKDTSEIFVGYMISVWNWEGEQGYAYADSLIAFAEATGELDDLSRAYYVKGGRYYMDDMPIKALDEFIISYKFALLANDPDYLAESLELIASIKAEHGEEAEAIKIRREILKIIKENEANNSAFSNYNESKLSAFDGLARGYILNDNIDSARYFAKKGIDLSTEINNDFLYYRLVVLDAQINYEDNVFIKARDTLLKYLGQDTPIGEADMYYYLGMLEEEIGDPEMKSVYFKKYDSILSTEAYPIIDNVKEVYQFLVQDAIEDDDSTFQNYYMDRLVYYDSLIEQTNKAIKNITLTKFDLPLQQQEKDSYELTLFKKDRTLRILTVILLLATLGLLLFYFRYVKIKRRFSLVMSESIIPVVENEETSVKKSLTLGIEKETIEAILENLTQWENELGYLDHEIDQNVLAKALGTNSTYLSRVINAHKKQNFSQYLNDLRATYAVNHLKENPTLARSKSLIQLAEQFGFKSTDSFIRAFKSKVGNTPSVFLRRLKRRDL